MLLTQAVLAKPPTVLRLARSEGYEIDPVPKLCNGLCLDRDRVDIVNVIIESEAQCRKDLITCRDQKVKVVETGWQTWEVILLTAGVAIAAASVGIVVGRFML